MTQPARFKQADATRAIRAAVKAGVRVGAVEIDPTGTIRIISTDSVPLAAMNPLDRLLSR